VIRLLLEAHGFFILKGAWVFGLAHAC